jgi:hypothetical protein
MFLLKNKISGILKTHKGTGLCLRLSNGFSLELINNVCNGLFQDMKSVFE